MGGVGNVALAFGLCSCCFQACGGARGLGGGLVTSRLSSVYVLLWVPDVFVLFSRLGGGGGVRAGRLVTARLFPVYVRSTTILQTMISGGG